MTTTANCVHHWLLGDPGPRVPGLCTACGERREFDGGEDYYEGPVEASHTRRARTAYASKGGEAKKRAKRAPANAGRRDHRSVYEDMREPRPEDYA